MLVSQFYFNLPKHAIAHQPVSPRDAAKMLVVSDDIQHAHVSDLPDYLSTGDVLVFNNTKVIPARLTLKQEGREIEVTLHKQMAGDTWKAFAKPARKLKIGIPAIIGEDFSCQVVEKNEGEVTLHFNVADDLLVKRLHDYGRMPLPPYIQNMRDGVDDHVRYQTIYAQHEGAVAAPTAGLHFTESLFAKLQAKHIQIVMVTLHVGAGTFLPVKVEDTNDHIMHSEYGVITSDAAETINAAKAQGYKVVAVGTTSLRILETAADEEGRIGEFRGDTSIFITPGYQFKIVDELFTNFHLPESTLFMLVSAFSGLEVMQNAYACAIANDYRFYSYGDACLLKKRAPTHE